MNRMRSIVGCNVFMGTLVCAIFGAPAFGAESGEVVLAAPGRIEGASETLRLGTSAQAPVASVLVKAGERVKAGQTLIELQCADLKAEQAALSARAEMAAARMKKVEGGYRREEIEEAAAALRAAQAEGERASAQAVRIRELHAKQMLSAAALDSAVRDERVAAGHLSAAKARLALLRAGYRTEERVEAVAESQALARSLQAATERLALCSLRAPIDGEVVRVHVTRGELVSPLAAATLVSLADVSRFRVRAEVDERDVAQIRVGQPARILVTALPGKSFAATVEEVSRGMGRKRTLTNDPAEKSDRDVLEVLLGVASEPTLPLGLRVTVQFLR